MSVYVGIDVHRKRSQVAVVTGDGDGRAQQERGERLRADAAADRRLGRRDAGGVRGRVRLGVAGRTAGGLRLRGAPGAPAAGQGDRLGPAEERQGPAPRPWPSCCARTCSRRRGSRRRRSGSSGRCCGTGPGWSGCAPSGRTASTRWWPISASTGPAATCPGRAAAGWPSSSCPWRHGRSSPTAWRSPAGLAARDQGDRHHPFRRWRYTEETPGAAITPTRTTAPARSQTPRPSPPRTSPSTCGEAAEDTWRRHGSPAVPARDPRLSSKAYRLASALTTLMFVTNGR